MELLDAKSVAGLLQVSPGQTSLTLDQVERLAEFFGLELRPIESAKPKKGRK